MSDNVEHRKVKKGVVVSNKMQNTVVVRVNRVLRHPRYDKVITRSKKYYAHVEDTSLNVGDEVTIIETRPLSKLKRWRVVKTDQAH
jgi:30S ribosomal protein S17